MNTLAPSKRGKLIAVSPHLDDAVLGCGELVAQFPGTIVVTVFAGAPPDCDILTDWDAASGFSSAGQAVTQRRSEDQAALDTLAAIPHWLDFCDSQYGVTPPVGTLADVLCKFIAETEAETILIPAGLFHSDHALVHDAMLRVRDLRQARTWLMYEEPSYRQVPGLLQQRLGALLQAQILATPFTHLTSHAAAKRQAVHCYASQLRALQQVVKSGYSDAFAPERYWRLEDAPAANR